MKVALSLSHIQLGEFYHGMYETHRNQSIAKGYT